MRHRFVTPTGTVEVRDGTEVLGRAILTDGQGSGLAQEVEHQITRTALTRR